MNKVLVVGTGIDKDKLEVLAAHLGLCVMEVTEAIEKLGNSVDLASYAMDNIKELALEVQKIRSIKENFDEHRGKHRTHRNKWKK